MADCFGQFAVFGRNLIQRLRHERFVDQLNAACERAFDARNHKIEVIKRPDLDLACGAALRGLRIDVVEAREAGRVLDLAEQRQRVPPLQSICGGLGMGGFNRGKVRHEPECRSHGGCGAALQKVSSGNRQMQNSCCGLNGR